MIFFIFIWLPFAVFGYSYKIIVVKFLRKPSVGETYKSNHPLHNQVHKVFFLLFLATIL